MPAKPRLLVTGFGPFPGMKRNPSAALAEAIAASPRFRLHGVSARSATLTTAYSTLPVELDPLLAEEPDAVLLIGVAGRSGRVRVEARATSRRSKLFPDAHGAVPGTRGAARPVSNHMRLAKVNIRAALRRLAIRRLPARMSRDAGRYLCNAAYFRALERRGATLFVHIPKVPPPRPRRAGRGGSERLVGPSWNAALARALTDVGLDMVRHARRVAAPAVIR